MTNKARLIDLYNDASLKAEAYRANLGNLQYEHEYFLAWKQAEDAYDSLHSQLRCGELWPEDKYVFTLPKL